MNAQTIPESSWEALDAAIADKALSYHAAMARADRAQSEARAIHRELVALIDSRSKEHVRFLEERKGLR